MSTASPASLEAPVEQVDAAMAALGRAARAAAGELARASTATKDAALRAAATSIRSSAASLGEANQRDLAEARDLSPALRDRLELNEARIAAMAMGLDEIAELPDPVGEVLAEWTRPNGLRISRVRVPLGVIGMIYESRPNVTADAGGLCLKSANAVILRGGSESLHSSRAIHRCLETGLRAAGLPGGAIQLVATAERAAVGALLRMNEYVDIIVPRGGKSLIERVQAESRIPVIAHLDGNCHVYVDRAANPEMAREIVVNAKMRRTGICGAAESLLIDRPVAASHLPPILDALFAAGCQVRGDAAARAIDPRLGVAHDADWGHRISRCDHLGRRGRWRRGGDRAHRPARLAPYREHCPPTMRRRRRSFLGELDSAIVMHNASTQFADGGEFGMGAEIGISTSKLHARGPVGVEQLTSFKYVVRGAGQVRP